MRRIIGFALAFAGLVWAADLAACTTAIVRAGASASGRPMIWNKARDMLSRASWTKAARTRSGTGPTKPAS